MARAVLTKMMAVVLLHAVAACDPTPRLMAGPAPGTWMPRAAMPTPRSELPAVMVDGALYLPGGLGGLEVFERYDPRTDSWRRLAPLPAGRHHAMATGFRGRVYLFGGYDADWKPTATAWVYDPATDRWSALPDLPEPRAAGAAVAAGDALCVVGGTGGGQGLLCFDATSGAWGLMAPLTEQREHHAAVIRDGRIHALGGRWKGKGELDSVEVYDPDGDRWLPGPAMLRARAGFGAAMVGERLVAAGGEILLSGRETLDSVEVYDADSRRWVAGPRLPVAVHGAAVAAVGEQIYVLGGSDRAGAAENHGRVWVWTPAR